MPYRNSFKAYLTASSHSYNQRRGLNKEYQYLLVAGIITTHVMSFNKVLLSSFYSFLLSYQFPDRPNLYVGVSMQKHFWFNVFSQSIKRETDKNKVEGQAALPTERKKKQSTLKYKDIAPDGI